MATREDAIAFLEKLKETKPAEPINELSNKNKGLSFVLKYISDHDGKAYTNDISNKMHISTARVSAIINKLEDRGLVTRQDSKTDARKTIIVLTDKGASFVKEMEESLIQTTIHLINTVGMDELMEFLRITKDIHNAMHGYGQFCKKLEEIYND